MTGKKSYDAQAFLYLNILRYSFDGFFFRHRLRVLMTLKMDALNLAKHQ